MLVKKIEIAFVELRRSGMLKKSKFFRTVVVGHEPRRRICSIAKLRKLICALRKVVYDLPHRLPTHIAHASNALDFYISAPIGEVKQTS
jgi:hypothetical protein